jgi:soluble lytic murein transglycosylase-like protein
MLALGVQASAAEIAVLRNGFSIRHDRHENVEQSTRLFVGSNWVDVPSGEIERFEVEDVPVASPPAPDFSDAVNAASGRHQIDRDLISSIISAESGFQQRAVSRKGAQGLMQLMPGTASRLGIKDAFDPAANVEGGTRYLRELLMRYKGDLVKALAAYNAGPKRVEQYKGVPPYRETQAYVSRIIRDYNRKKLAERSGAARNSSTPPGAGSQP